MCLCVSHVVVGLCVSVCACVFVCVCVCVDFVCLLDCACLCVCVCCVVIVFMSGCLMFDVRTCLYMFVFVYVLFA